MQYESTFNAIDNILRNEAGCSTELDYIEQTSWLLFLKYLDDLEAEREMNALMEGKEYKRIITGFMRWSQWAAPKKADGSPDDINCMTGPDLQQFVDTKLFPALREFQNTASSARSLEYKIGEIFAELRNKITSGYNLREIINLIDTLRFQSAEDKHEMTVLYESKIGKMGNAGRNGGEYYTPRPLIRTIVKVVNPKIGESVYDPACGSAGFLCEAFTYMQAKVKSTKDVKTLQENTFFGKEKKPLPYIIATMNMIFHGVAAPNIIRGNTLAENLNQIQEKDRKDVILANPPFGGSERGEVLQNFDLRTSETAYMFMQHFIKMLRAGGRAGIVIKNTFLSNGDAAALRKMLLEFCNLHTILDLPSGVFQGAGVKTVVLFFEKGVKTEKIWYYQLNPGRNLGKTNALNEDDLAEFVKLYATKGDSENSWSIDVKSLGADCDLSVKNPNRVEEKDERSSKEIMESLVTLNGDANEILSRLQELL
ncbi:MAG: type I restriction-modification system subunit M [Bacteroidaceae bacterium]|nr:type I restriction-modification system subunit M [Bacteroidaceae bacterium]